MNSTEGENKLSRRVEYLQTTEQLQKFWAAFRKNNGIHSSNERGERIALEQLSKQLAGGVAAGTEIPAGIQEDDEMIATGKLSIREKGKGKEGYLGFLTVDSGHQGKGLGNEVVNALLLTASERECVRVVAEVLVENVFGGRSMGTLIKSGFLLESAAEGDDGGVSKFILAKSFEDQDPVDDKKESVIEKVSLVDIQRIKHLLNEGYKGISIIRTEENQFTVELKKYGSKQ